MKMAEKYYLIAVRYGQIGQNCLLSVTFPVIADSRKRAWGLASSIPFVGKTAKEAVTIDEVTFSEYMSHKMDSAFIPYNSYSDLEGLRGPDAASLGAIDLLADDEICRLKKELEEARAENEKLEELLRANAGVHSEAVELFDRNAKILLLGGGQKLDENRMKMTLTKLGMSKDCLEWHKYDELKNFNIRNVIHSRKYSDIIVSHSPHKARGIGDSKSVAGYLRDHQEDIVGQIQFLKSPNREGFDELTQTSFKTVVKKTLLYKKVHNLLPIEKYNYFGDIAA